MSEDAGLNLLKREGLTRAELWIIAVGLAVAIVATNFALFNRSCKDLSRVEAAPIVRLR